jgi:GT2 family glycosyltransferase
MMSGPPLVYIVILNWNGWQDTLACVASCRQLIWPEFRILVVDNGSTDDSETVLRERLAPGEFLQSGGNLGFAGGNNVGIRQALAAGAEYVWLLNNDTEVAPEALTELVSVLQATPAVGMATSKIYLYDEPRRLNFAGGLWEPGRLRRRLLGANELDRGQYDEPAERGSVSGCSLLVSARMIRDIGLMDEAYFLYWEDTDWCARAMQRGYAIRYAPQSHVWHKVSASTGQDSFAQHYYLFRNGLYFLRKYDPVRLPLFALYNLLFGLQSLLSGRLQAGNGLVKGLIDYRRGVRGQFPGHRTGRDATARAHHD